MFLLSVLNPFLGIIYGCPVILTNTTAFIGMRVLWNLYYLSLVISTHKAELYFTVFIPTWNI